MTPTENIKEYSLGLNNTCGFLIQIWPIFFPEKLSALDALIFKTRKGRGSHGGWKLMGLQPSVLFLHLAGYALGTLELWHLLWFLRLRTTPAVVLQSEIIPVPSSVLLFSLEIFVNHSPLACPCLEVWNKASVCSFSLPLHLRVPLVVNKSEE